MKLSELLVKGSKGHVRIKGQYFTRNVLNRITKCCVVGAIRLGADADGNIDFSEIMAPDPRTHQCPVKRCTHRPIGFESLLIHVNDFHDWPFSKTKTWLEGRDL